MKLDGSGGDLEAPRPRLRSLRRRRAYTSCCVSCFRATWNFGRAETPRREPNVDQFWKCIELAEAKFTYNAVSSSCFAILCNSIQSLVHTSAFKTSRPSHKPRRNSQCMAPHPNKPQQFLPMHDFLRCLDLSSAFDDGIFGHSNIVSRRLKTRL
jgi:hypothetical protein